MNIPVGEFYSMSIEDFSLKVEGFFDNRAHLDQSLRRIAAIIQSGIPYKNPPKPMEQQWPIRGDKERGVLAKERTDKNNIDAFNKLLGIAKKSNGT